MDKVVFRAYAGKTGPMFLTLRGLMLGAPGEQLTILTPTRTMGFQNPYSLLGEEAFLNYQIPWIDFEFWIDAHAEYTMIQVHRVEMPGDNVIIGLDRCPDMPADLVAKAKETRKNLLGGGSNLRSGNFIFAYGGGVATRSGYVLMRFDPKLVGSRNAECVGFASAPQLFQVPTKWVPLNAGLPEGLRTYSTTLVSSVATQGGILAHYLQDILDTSGGTERFTPMVSRLAFIDTNGVETVLDSARIGIREQTKYDYVKLFSFKGQAYAAARDGLVKIDAATRSVTLLRAGNVFHAPFDRWYGTSEVDGKMIVFGPNGILSTDMSTFEVKQISLRGLEGNHITGVVQVRDTVYVSTLSGIYTKPVREFLEAR